MIRKFVMVLACAVGLLPGTTLFAQQTPTQQTPAAPPPADQQRAAQAPADQQPTAPEASDEDTTRQRKAHVHDYNNWSFSVGAGSSLPHGTTKTFVKGGGTVVQAAVARNANKYLGLRLDLTWINLPLRNSALQLAQASGANNHAYDLSLDPIINIPLTKRYSGYLVLGPSFIRRSGKIDSSNVLPGTPCNAFWNYWGTCFNNSVPLDKDFLSERLNEFGYNVGGGVARKFGEERHEVYAEFRLLHGSHNNNTTDVRALTVGLRW